MAVNLRLTTGLILSCFLQQSIFCGVLHKEEAGFVEKHGVKNIGSVSQIELQGIEHGQFYSFADEEKVREQFEIPAEESQNLQQETTRIGKTRKCFNCLQDARTSMISSHPGMRLPAQPNIPSWAFPTSPSFPTFPTFPPFTYPTFPTFPPFTFPTIPTFPTFTFPTFTLPTLPTITLPTLPTLPTIPTASTTSETSATSEPPSETSETSEPSPATPEPSAETPESSSENSADPTES